MRQLESARRKARAVDLSGLKGSVVGWDKYDPPIPPENKAVRGMHHLQILILLCPATLNPLDPAYVSLFPLISSDIETSMNSVQRGLMEGSRAYPVGPNDFCYLLWEDEKVDHEALHEGFCRNRRLIFMRVIMTSVASCSFSL